MINDIAERGRGYSFDILRAKCLYGTKATKQEKYDFKRYIQKQQSHRTPGFGFAYATSFGYDEDAVVEKELVSGFGVDIEELRTYINNEFWLKMFS